MGKKAFKLSVFMLVIASILFGNLSVYSFHQERPGIKISHLQLTDGESEVLELEKFERNTLKVVGSVDVSRDADTVKLVLSDNFKMIESSAAKTYSVQGNSLTVPVLNGTFSAELDVSYIGDDTTLVISDESGLVLKSLSFNIVDSKKGAASALNSRRAYSVSQNLISDVSITKTNGTAITSANRVDLTEGSGEQVRVRMDLTILKEYAIKRGDTYSFELPEGLEIFGGGFSGELVSFGGTYWISYDGFVTVTFNEEIEVFATDGPNNVALIFDTPLNRDYFKNKSVNTEVVYDTQDDTVHIPLFTKPIVSQPLEKFGQPNRTYNASSITWSVIVNKRLDTLSELKIIDTLPGNVEIAESILIESLDLSGSGNVLGSSIVTSGYDIDLSDGLLTVNFHDTVDEAYKITYTTNILNQSQLTGVHNFINNVEYMSESGLNVTTHAKVEARYGEPIQKLSYYDASKPIIDWTLKYNYNQATLDDGDAWIVDMFSNNSKMVDVSSGNLVEVYEVAIDESGSETRGRLLNPDEYVFTKVENESENTRGFELRILGTTDKAYTILYRTRIAVPIQSKIIQVDNTVTTASGQEKKVSRSIEQYMLKKSVDYDYNMKTADWKIVFNNSESSETVTFVTIGDKLGEGLKLRGAIVVKDDTLDVVLTEGIDYVVNYPKSDPEYVSPSNAGGKNEVFKNDVFRIDFIGDYFTFDNQISVAYTTDLTRIASGKSYTNDAQSHYTFPGFGDAIWAHNQNGVAFPNNIVVSSDIYKEGYYDANLKQITWTVYTNFDAIDLLNASIEDKILPGQTYVPGSLRVMHFNVSAKGQLSFGDSLHESQYILKTPVADDPMLRVNITQNFTGDKARIAVQFKTSVASPHINREYVNTASYINQGLPPVSDDAKVLISYTEPYVSKSGKQGSGSEGNRIKWNVIVNESQSTITGLSLKDTLGEDHAYVDGTLKLYGSKIVNNKPVKDANNLLQESVDYKLEINKNMVTGISVVDITFMYSVDRAYFIEYQTIFDVENGAYVCNSVNAKDGEFELETTAACVKVVTSGPVNPDNQFRGQITINKTDGISPIQGTASFELYRKSTGGPVLVRSGSTVNGSVTFTNLQYGVYSVKEVSPPSGYFISDALYEGVEVLLDNNEDGATLTYEAVNHKPFITIKKSAIDPSVKLVATFELINSHGDIVSTVTTDALGVAVFENLDWGTYTVRETVAAQGYILNTLPQTVVVALQDDNTFNASITELEFINYKGSVILNKVNSDNEPLSGVVYDVMSSFDNYIGTYTTDSEGAITVNDLEPGMYYFIERSSVSGHIVNDSPLHFSITEKFDGEPEPVRLIATNYKGVVEFKKTDSYGNPLSGIEFTLYEDETDTEYVKVSSDVNGKVHVDQLTPGTYYFLETKGNPDYIVNKTKHEFEIPDTSITGLVVLELEDFINYQGSLRVEKVNKHGVLLDDAHFELRNLSDNSVRSLVTKEGIAIINDLKPGEYILTEVQAPKGYLINQASNIFVVPETHGGKYETTVVRVINFTDPNYIPDTGISPMIQHISVVAVIAGFVCILVSKSRKSKK